MTDKIKTSGGTGSPAYLDSNAPTGLQFQDAAGVQIKIPDGTFVQKTATDPNEFVPPYIEIKILSGTYIGKIVWVKSTHVITETDPIPPEPGTPAEFQKVVGIYIKLSPFGLFLQTEKVENPVK